MQTLALLLAIACDPIAGTFEAVDTVCAESSIGLCIDGTFDGDLSADYLGAFQTLSPAPTLAQPLRLAYTSSDTFVTNSGTFTAETEGHIVLNDVVGALVCVLACNGDGACIADCVIAHASTSFTNSTVFENGLGDLEAAGTGSYLDGVSRGTYAGDLCESVD